MIADDHPDARRRLQSLFDLRDDMQIGVCAIDLDNEVGPRSGKLCGAPPTGKARPGAANTG